MYNYPAGCVQRPGWVLFTSRGQAGGLCTDGCRGNCSDRPARVSLCALCARLSCSLPCALQGRDLDRCHRSRSLASFRSVQVIYLAFGSVGNGRALLALIAPLRRFAAIPSRRCRVTFFLLDMRSMEPRRQARSTGRAAASPGLGAASQQASVDIKTISTLIACLFTQNKGVTG